MRKCRYQGDLDCTEPLLLCKACPVAKKAAEESKAALVSVPKFPSLPDPRPYAKVGSPSGAPGLGVEIGIKGTF